MLCIILFSGSLREISLAFTRKMVSRHIHLIPGQKLCLSCPEDSEENNDEWYK